MSEFPETRPDRSSPAESESNPPEDRVLGWRPWVGIHPRTGAPVTERWWTGKQWMELYR